ncbi:MAG: acetyl-CoA decarbonylase/synthase complex subunit delta [Anaerolineae bacterium]|nr:acetyl-CoA decarbonylase/synthase complex subunit delta [Anaerolineae bacterium]
MAFEIPKDNWPGEVRQVTIGAAAADGGSRSHSVVVGGAKALPFIYTDAPTVNRPKIALEISDQFPKDWSKILLDVWGDVTNDPGEWAKAVENLGADLILLSLSLQHNGEETKPEQAVQAVHKVLEASSLPLMVFGPGQADVDNDLLVPVADAAKGERIVLGICEDKNYRTIVASALANDHLVNSRTPMDVNLAKQLIILIHDMGLPLERILMDPTTGALGYGIEYGYSVMERLRLAALQGDSMTQSPMLVTPGYETWKTKEAKVGTDVPPEWGDWEERGIQWETLTAVTLLESGADIVVLRHPESFRRVSAAIESLSAARELA